MITRIVGAGPAFPGELRRTLSKTLHQVVAAELRRQLSWNALDPPL